MDCEILLQIAERALAGACYRSQPQRSNFAMSALRQRRIVKNLKSQIKSSQRVKREQADRHNSREALREDDKIYPDEQCRPKVYGSGRWRSMTDEAMIRVSFEELQSGPQALARRYKQLGPGSVSLARCCMAEWGREAYSRAIMNVEPCANSLYNILHDDTKFNVMMPYKGARSVELMAQHGLVVRQNTISENRCVEENVVEPTAIETNSAEILANAIEIKQGRAWRHILDSAQYACLAITEDSIRSNVRCSAHILNTLPEGKFGLRVPCMQHQAGLILATLTRAFGLLTPLFCIVKQLLNSDVIDALETAVEGMLMSDLEWNSEEGPEPSHQEHMSDLLEKLYYSINCSTDMMTDEEKEIHKREDEKRRQEGAEIASAFTGDPARMEICHHCTINADGFPCCRTREEAVRKCKDALMTPLKRHLDVPATNKWLTMWPVVTLVALLLSIHGLLRRAYRRVYDSTPSTGDKYSSDAHEI